MQQSQPEATVTVTRPWGWGGAYLHDAGYYETLDDEAEPTLDPEQHLTLSVRHAQDVEFEDDEPDLTPLAEATLTFVFWVEPPTGERPGTVLLDTVVLTPSEMLAVGDPEYTIHLPVWSPATRVRVSGAGASWGDDHVWIDLCPADPP